MVKGFILIPQALSENTLNTLVTGDMKTDTRHSHSCSEGKIYNVYRALAYNKGQGLGIIFYLGKQTVTQKGNDARAEFENIGLTEIKGYHRANEVHLQKAGW